MKGLTYYHPLRETQILPLLRGDHVTMSKGTGFVHTAPAHGPEDFLVALQNQMPIVIPPPVVLNVFVAAITKSNNFDSMK